MQGKLPKLKFSLATNEPEVLKKTGKDSLRTATNKLTIRDINRIIDATRLRGKQHQWNLTSGICWKLANVQSVLDFLVLYQSPFQPKPDLNRPPATSQRFSERNIQGQTGRFTVFGESGCKQSVNVPSVPGFRPHAKNALCGPPATRHPPSVV